MYKKKKITKTLKGDVWYEWNGDKNSVKCPVEWCQNEITLDTCHMGHNKPESLGGLTKKENLVPICWMCNLAMKNIYTILQWSALPRSKRNRQHIDVCAECYKPTGDNSTNHLVLCDGENCTRCYCLECLRISEDDLPDSWYCGYCDIPLPSNIQIKKGMFRTTNQKINGEFVM